MPKRVNPSHFFFFIGLHGHHSNCEIFQAQESISNDLDIYLKCTQQIALEFSGAYSILATDNDIITYKSRSVHPWGFRGIKRELSFGLY